MGVGVGVGEILGVGVGVGVGVGQTPIPRQETSAFQRDAYDAKIPTIIPKKRSEKMAKSAFFCRIFRFMCFTNSKKWGEKFMLFYQRNEEKAMDFS